MEYATWATISWESIAVPGYSMKRPTSPDNVKYMRDSTRLLSFCRINYPAAGSHAANEWTREPQLEIVGLRANTQAAYYTSPEAIYKLANGLALYR